MPNMEGGSSEHLPKRNFNITVELSPNYEDMSDEEREEMEGEGCRIEYIQIEAVSESEAKKIALETEFGGKKPTRVLEIKEDEE